MEVTDSDKHSSLLGYGLIMMRQMFYCTGPCCMFVFKGKKLNNNETLEEEEPFSKSFFENLVFPTCKTEDDLQILKRKQIK